MSSIRHNQFSDATPSNSQQGGLVAGTCVMTMDGELPVEYLTPGDRILTRAGLRLLSSIAVRVDQNVEMVRVGAGTLGHDRPGSETLLPLHQMLLIRDWRAQVLYGAPQALVAAGRLADGVHNRIEAVAEVRLFTLTFAQDVVIYAGGLEVACLRESVNA